MSCVSLPNQLFLKFTNLLKTMLETYFWQRNKSPKHFAFFEFHSPAIFPYCKNIDILFFGYEIRFKQDWYYQNEFYQNKFNQNEFHKFDFILIDLSHQN